MFSLSIKYAMSRCDQELQTAWLHITITRTCGEIEIIAMTKMTCCIELGLKECMNCEGRHYIKYCFINLYSHIISDKGIVAALKIARENISNKRYMGAGEFDYIRAAVNAYHPEFKDRLDKILLLM
jgi:hypothetical protein